MHTGWRGGIVIESHFGALVSRLKPTVMVKLPGKE